MTAEGRLEYSQGERRKSGEQFCMNEGPNEGGSEEAKEREQDILL